MAWIKLPWENIIGSDAVKVTITPGGNTFGDFDCKGTHPNLKISVRTEIIFGSTPMNNACISIYGLDKSGSNEPDTTPIMSHEIKRKASQSSIYTIPNIDVMALDSLRMKICNLDTSYSIQVWVSLLASYKN